MNSERSHDSVLIEAANKAYHRMEAELYDDSHPEILWCERKHWKSFLSMYMSGHDRPIRVLDVGAGTGFLGRMCKDVLIANDAYVAVDLSNEMLQKLRTSLTGSSFAVETHVGSASYLPFADQSFDFVFMNSAVHHFPNVEAALREASRVLKKDGIFAVMHEPNIRFSDSFFFRSMARVFSVLAYRFDRPSVGAQRRPDYGPVFSHVNKELLSQGLIERSLSESEIQALVDVHSPTARGTYERVGFDVREWQRKIFPDWDVLESYSYNFLGKIDPSAFRWRSIVEKFFSLVASPYGSLFTYIVRKP